MSPPRSVAYLESLVRELCALPRECEWVEFKRNNDDPQEIGEYISALANTAALVGKGSAYVLWGVRDELILYVNTTGYAANLWPSCCCDSCIGQQ